MVKLVNGSLGKRRLVSFKLTLPVFSQQMASYHVEVVGWRCYANDLDVAILMGTIDTFLARPRTSLFVAHQKESLYSGR